MPEIRNMGRASQIQIPYIFAKAADIQMKLHRLRLTRYCMPIALHNNRKQQ